MKILILQLESKYLPANQPAHYPSHNDDYGVEQDFFAFLKNHPELTTDQPDEADWHYLPVYWTRWHINHDYAASGLEELQQAVDQVILDEKKTFTICQYDDGPLVNLGSSVQFLASRKTAVGIDIPLLCSPHKLPFIKPPKKYLAAFIGRYFTHPIRQQMADQIKNRKDVFLYDGDNGTKFYLNKMLASRIALCPRGYGGSSFRFFEAMQLGITPYLIGDIDTRPFKSFIDWEIFSLYSPNLETLVSTLESKNHKQLEIMGKSASLKWKNDLTYQRWCSFVIKELESLI
jgi:hypothetical protein